MRALLRSYKTEINPTQEQIQKIKTGRFVSNFYIVFKLHSEYRPTGDQPQAIEALVRGFREGKLKFISVVITGRGCFNLRKEMIT